jgi:aryl-alcohol dehydrogenase-like predicted oxidoreductase
MLTRRELVALVGSTVTGLWAAGRDAHAAPPAKPDAPIPTRPFGKTGVEVSSLALGGAHLGGIRDEAEAIAIVHEALDHGLTFLDNAWEYHDGRSEELVGKALRGGRRDRAFVMTKVCSHGRAKRVALKQLDESLRRLGTDHLDLWQIHEVVWADDPARHYAKGGAIEALAEAKQRGKARFVGFTGHKSPELHLDMLGRGFPFDSVQMPLNVFDATFRSFEQRVLPDVQRRGMAALGMKSLGGAGDPVRRGVVTVEEALRYALTLPVATVVSGIDSRAVLRQNLAIARMPRLTPSEMEALRRRVAPEAADGRFEPFKISMRYDGAVGRAQHGVSTTSD